MDEGAPPIAITPEHGRILRAILSSHVPRYPVWAFGSRARGQAKPYSDLDLAVVTDTPMRLAAQADLAAAFSDSDLPWRVDVVDWSVGSDAVRAIIARDKFVLTEGDRG